MHTVEIFLTDEKITAEQWREAVLSLAKQVGGLQPFSIVVSFQENLMRMFMVSKHDLSSLSGGLTGMVLSPVDEETAKKIHKPTHAKTRRFLKLPVGGNLIAVKERYKVKEGLDLSMVHLDVQRVGGARLFAKMHCYFTFGESLTASHQQLALFPAHLLDIDFETSSNYLRKAPPRYVNLEKSMHLFVSENINAVFSIPAYPYFSHDYYLNLTSYDFDKHSLIIGASGSGKSKLIELFIDRLQKTSLVNDYRVIVIDPHANLDKDLQYLKSTKVVNFKGESTQLFPDAEADITAATELTTTLFQSLIGDQFTPRLERVLRFSLYVLFVSQSMSMDMLKTFLTDLEVRSKILNHVKGYIPDNIERFFGADYNEIRTQYFNEAVMPIISLVEEMQLQPSLVGESEKSLAKTISDNFLTVFSLNKVSMGEKVVKTVAGLLIQQIFLLAQAKVFGKKVILIIDEVSVVQNPALASILAEARKFNLSVILTQQYFGQIDEKLRESILSNVINYYAFKVSEDDAKMLEGNMNIDIPKEVVDEGEKKGLKEKDIRIKLLSELHPRECLVRLSASGQLIPCIKARTVDTEQRAGSIVQAGGVQNTVELESFKKAELPTKFDINVVDAMKQLEEATEVNYGPQPTLPAEQGVEQAEQPAFQPMQNSLQQNEPAVSSPAQDDRMGPGMSLSQLLASQSSSRRKLK